MRNAVRENASSKLEARIVDLQLSSVANTLDIKSSQAFLHGVETIRDSMSCSFHIFIKIHPRLLNLSADYFMLK